MTRRQFATNTDGVRILQMDPAACARYLRKTYALTVTAAQLREYRALGLGPGGRGPQLDGPAWLVPEYLDRWAAWAKRHARGLVT